MRLIPLTHQNTNAMAVLANTPRCHKKPCYRISAIQTRYFTFRSSSFCGRKSVMWHVGDSERHLLDCRATSQNFKLNVKPAVWAYSLRRKMSRGWNLLPAATTHFSRWMEKISYFSLHFTSLLCTFLSHNPFTYTHTFKCLMHNSLNTMFSKTHLY